MLVEQDSLKYWTKGSYEWLRNETAKAIKEAKSEIDFTCKLIATFSNHAIIVSSKAEFFRCTLQETENFGRKVVRVEKIQGPKVYRDGIETEKYYEAKTSSAVSSLLESSNVGDLVSSLMMDEGQLDSGRAISEQLQRLMDDRTLWNSYYEQNEHRILRASWRVEDTRKDEISSSPSELARRSRLLTVRAINIGRSGQDDRINEAADSVANFCEEIEYWLSKMIRETELPSAYGAVSQGLIECLQKIDKFLTYADGLRGRR